MGVPQTEWLIMENQKITYIIYLIGGTPMT